MWAVTEDRVAWAQYNQPMGDSGCLMLQNLALGLGVLPAQLPSPAHPHREPLPPRPRAHFIPPIPAPILVAVAGEPANFRG